MKTLKTSKFSTPAIGTEQSPGSERARQMTIANETPNIIYIHGQLAIKVNDVFDWIFVRPHGLSLFRAWSNITGFDIVKFHDAIETGKNESVGESTKKQFGKMGYNLIKLLISSPEQMKKYLDSPEGQLGFSAQYEMFKNGSLKFGQ